MKKYLISLWAFTVVFVVGFCFSIVKHDSYSTSEDSFVVNKPYLSVVKSLASKESLEKVVEENNGILKNKQWQSFTVEVPKRIFKVKEYNLEGLLYFTVEKHDADLGDLSLLFEQKVFVNKDVFKINTNLREPQKNVSICNKFIEISPSLDDSLKTQVLIKNELKINKLIPFFFNKLMDSKVKYAAEKDLNILRSNILLIVQDTTPTLTLKIKTPSL
jgi:hypothetical protein